MTTVLLDPGIVIDCAYSLQMMHNEIQLTPSVVNGCYIWRVDHLKEKTTMDHELLLLFAIKDDHHMLLRVERRPTTRKPGDVTCASGPSYTRLTSDTISRVSDDFSHARHHYISTVTFSPSQPLDRLVEICGEIYAQAPHYKLLSTQCYWYCKTLISRLRVFPEAKFVKGPDFKRAGCFKGARVVFQSAAEGAALDSANTQAVLQQSSFGKLRQFLCAERHKHCNAPRSPLGDATFLQNVGSPEDAGDPEITFASPASLQTCACHVQGHAIGSTRRDRDGCSRSLPVPTHDCVHPQAQQYPVTHDEEYGPHRFCERHTQAYPDSRQDPEARNYAYPDVSRRFQFSFLHSDSKRLYVHENGGHTGLAVDAPGS